MSFTETPISVSDLNRQAKSLLEASLGRILVTGELSSLSKPKSGHWYFTLKDERAQVRCAMFRGQNLKLSFSPKEGDELVVQGKVSLYEGRGDYQLIVDSLFPAGIGAMQRAFDELKLKLHKEGLFDAKHKKVLPKHAKRIAVITSKSGAVIHDIISVCHKRFPLLPILLIPVAVQGDQAASEIASAIKQCNERQLADVIIVGRGGGSMEDLWAFNEEVVARAIFKSTIPIVSAVGHEVDVTIADFVADYRAPTPSAAAEALTPDQFELTQKIDQLLQTLSMRINARLLINTEKLTHFKGRLKHPGQTLAEQQRDIEALRAQLTQAMTLKLSNQKLSISRHQQQLSLHSPSASIERFKNRLSVASQKQTSKINEKLNQERTRLKTAVLALDLTSPLATLGRGYAIASDINGQVIRNSEQVSPGDKVSVRLKDSSLSCTVDPTQ